MAKRVRGSRSTHRPGGQGPSRTKKTGASTPDADETAEATSAATQSADAGDTSGVVEAEYTEITATEPAAQVAATTTTAKPRRARRRSKSRQDDLASREAAEDVWVREDLRRIGIISVALLVALAVAWVVFYYVDVLNLY